MVGQLLVASPTMRESLFHHTVILILQHNEHGAFGIIVNRPIGEVSLVKLEQLIGEKDKKAEGSVLLFYGSPINRAFVLVVHSTDYRQRSWCSCCSVASADTMVVVGKSEPGSLTGLA